MLLMLGSERLIGVNAELKMLLIVSLKLFIFGLYLFCVMKQSQFINRFSVIALLVLSNWCILD